jgi:CHAT domain-containing protein/tetratricopeptide (TPR) repeat protein
MKRQLLQRSRRLLGLVAPAFVCMSLTAAQAVLAQPPADKPEAGGNGAVAPSERQRLLADQRRLEREQYKLAAEAKHAEALAIVEKREPLVRQIAATFPDLKGEMDAQLVRLGSQRASLLMYLGRPSESLQAVAAEIETSVHAFGNEHWRTVSARVHLEYVQKLAAVDDDTRARMFELENSANAAAGERRFGEAIERIEQLKEIEAKVLGPQHPYYANSLANIAEWLADSGDSSKAIEYHRQTLAIRQKAYGPDHPDCAHTLSELSSLYRSMADYEQAAALARQVLDIRRKVLGEEHSDSVATLSTLGSIYRAMGAYEQSESHYLRALAIREKLFGKEHVACAASLSDLAYMYLEMRDYTRATPLFLRALEIRGKVLGEEHPDYAASLANVGYLYHSMRDYARAGPLLQRALSIRKKALPENHRDYVKSIAQLGSLYEEIGDYARAEPLLRQALELRRKILGEDHGDYAASLNSLGYLYDVSGQYARAEPLYLEAFEIRKKVLGETHLSCATSLNNLGYLYYEMGDSAQAIERYRQALAILKPIAGEEHPNYAITVGNMGIVYQAMGDLPRAEECYRQALAVFRRHLQLTAAAQSERQQLAMAEPFQGYLRFYVAVALAAGDFADSAYRQMLGWKGAVLARQRQLRAVGDTPELEPLWNELQSTAAQLARLALWAPAAASGADERRRQIANLSADKERLEAELARQSAAFREARAPVTLEEIQAALSEGAVLVDFLEYTHWLRPEENKGPRTSPRQLAAFVVRPTGPVRLVGLGEVQSIEEAIDRWRGTFGVSPQGESAGRLLRQKIWDPLEPLIEGAKVVLISPDGALARMPLAALPGKNPNRYLIEEQAVAMLPVPQLLPALVNEMPRNEPASNVLLLGGVDYGAEPREAASPKPRKTFPGRAARSVQQDWRGEFRELDATQGEIATVERRYRDVFGDSGITVLRGAAANEAALRALAPRHLYLHLATHGFFAPPKLRSALTLNPTEDKRDRSVATEGGSIDVAGFHPGLLSGVVLAGANRPPRADGDDGILTAEEVALLNLSGCRMCVLSACETGLGKVAGGEGLLGLQRAFQVAGVRSTVSSLWKVDDTATRSLMERFYKNLWEQELPAVEALRQAQIWMLRDQSNRGLAVSDQPATDHLPPYYWAAFVISGDWR